MPDAPVAAEYAWLRICRNIKVVINMHVQYVDKRKKIYEWC